MIHSADKSHEREMAAAHTAALTTDPRGGNRIISSHSTANQVITELQVDPSQSAANQFPSAEPGY